MAQELHAGCSVLAGRGPLTFVVGFSIIMLTQSFLEPVVEFFQQRFILVADDNRDLAISLAILLRLVSFEVEIVHNGRDALTAAQNRRPDLLLLDIGLPGMDGYEVARQFRSDEKLKSVFIIAISGYSPEMVSGTSAQWYFDHYFTKPVDFNMLLPIIRKAV
jgi:DNA-binding response OmpR family regulator